MVRSKAQTHFVVQDDDKSKLNFSLKGATLQNPISIQRPGSGRLGSTLPLEYSGESRTNRLVSADSSAAAKPVLKQQPGPGGLGTQRKGPIMMSRESSAKSKFGHCLVSVDSSAAGPSSHRTVTSSRRHPAVPSDEGHSMKVVTRDRTTRTPARSVRSLAGNILQNRAATQTTTALPYKVLSSPGPSEDSGVGLYRQIMTNDLSLNTSQISAATRTTIAAPSTILPSPAPSEGSGVGLYRPMMANDSDLSLNNDYAFIPLIILRFHLRYQLAALF